MDQEYDVGGAEDQKSMHEEAEEPEIPLPHRHSPQLEAFVIRLYLTTLVSTATTTPVTTTAPTTTICLSFPNN